MTEASPAAAGLGSSPSRAGEVFRAFLKLGLTAFGGPVAHLAYFREDLVVRRRWIDEAGYADLVALCQFLPGPASSQVGFALGLMRAGPLGALAAWAAFTLPSAFILVVCGYGAAAFEGPAGAGLLHGLKVVAVAVVAQAVRGMARTLAPDPARAGIAAAAALIVVAVPGPLEQVAAITAGGLAGSWLCPGRALVPNGHLAFPVPRGVALASLGLFSLLLILLPVLAAAVQNQGLALFDAFYRAGALVFGGGHAVLPLLETEVVRPGWVGADAFLAGYGVTQAMPGPLFTVAAYLGTVMEAAPNGLVGAALCLVAIFLPGFLLLVGALPLCDLVRSKPRAQAALRGANAAVVGILAVALYDPVGTGAISGLADLALAVAAFLMLTVWKTPPWIVVAIAAAAGAGLSVL